MSAVGKPVLIVAYGFPPYCRSLGGAIRALTLAEHLQDRGYDVTVLCVRTAHYDTFGYESLLARLRVVSVDDPAARWASRGARSLGGAGGVEAQSSGAAGRMRQMLKRLALELLTPDTGVTALGRLSKAALAWARAHPEGAVITTGPPHSVHLVGERLGRRVPGMRWLVDYRDSWNGTALFRKQFPMLQRMNMQLESRVLRKCDAFVYISKPMLKKALVIGPPELAEKAHLVANGFTADLLDLHQRGLAHADGVLRVGYFGALDDGQESYRNPACLFEALIGSPELSLRVEFYGPVRISSQWQLRLGERLHVGGTLPHKEALTTMAELDVLLLLHTRQDGADEVVTGKVFEYIASGRPIVAIGPEDMAVNELLAGDPSAYSVSHLDVPAIAALLRHLAASKSAGTLPARDTSRLESFTRRHQYQTFERLLGGSP